MRERKLTNWVNISVTKKSLNESEQLSSKQAQNSTKCAVMHLKTMPNLTFQPNTKKS